MFNGTSSSVVATMVDFEFPGSIGFWMYPTNVANATRQFMTMKRFGVSINMISSNIVFGGVSANIGFTATPLNNVWQHVGATSDGTNVKCYYNGVPSGTGSDSGSWVTGGVNVMIGVYQSFNTNWYAGALADVAWWQKVLNPAEWQALASGVRPNKISPQNLKMYYKLKLDEMAGLQYAQAVNLTGGTGANVVGWPDPPQIKPITFPGQSSIVVFRGPPPPPPPPLTASGFTWQEW